MAKKKIVKEVPVRIKPVPYDVGRDEDGTYVIAPRLREHKTENDNFVSQDLTGVSYVYPRDWHKLTDFRLKPGEGPVRIRFVG